MRQFNTLTGFLGSKASNPTTSDTVEFQGYSVIGAGPSKWQHNGVTGQTPSQSPAQLGDALLNDGSGSQWALVNKGIANFEALGGVSGGVTDNALVFQAFLNAGVIGVLANNKTYATSARSSWVLDKSGFISNGKSKVLMLSTGFNATTYAGYASNSVGFYALGFDNPIFKGIHIEFEAHGTTLRTANALAIRNCTNLDIDVEVSGLSEPQFGAIAMDSCIGGKCFVNVHDISTDDNTLPSMQLTGLQVDENRISSVYSKDVDLGNPIFKNITLGTLAVAAFGYQTDGLTFAGGSTSGTGGCKAGIVTVNNMGEGVDIQSSNHVISAIQAEDIFLSPLKIVHAGKNNSIGLVNAKNTGGPIVVIAGTITASESADNNIVGLVSGSGICDIAGGVKAGIHLSGSSATFKPNNNKIMAVNIVDSPLMLNTVLDEAGIKNKVYDVSGTGSLGVCQVDSLQHTLEHVDLRKSPKSFVRGYLSATQVGAIDGEVIKFNTVTTDSYSELNIATGVYESVGPMRGRISAALRTSTLGAGEYIGTDIVADGLVIASDKNWNDSAGNREGLVDIATNFTLNNRTDQVSVRLRTNAASLDITGNSEFTTLSIEEI